MHNDLERANRTISGAVGKMNAVLGTIGAGISVAFFADLGRKADEFRKSMALISTQIDDTNGELKQIEASAKKLATQFGNMPIEQSRAFYEILSAGITDVTQATDLLTTANKLAVGGNTTLAVSVDGLTNIMNSYAGKVKDAESVSDALFTGMKAGKATMEELSSGLGKVTPIASALNVSFDELVAAVSALSKQGIQTSESITGVRAILAAVAKPSSEAAKLANQLGLEFNAASIQAKGFAGFLDDVAKRTGGSTEKLALLFGGVESLVPMMALTGQAGKDFAQIMEDMGNKTGATGTAFEKAAVPGDKFRELMASINVIALEVGDALANFLAPAADMAAKALNALFGANQLSAIDKQKQKIAELQEQLASMNDRKNIPLVGDLIFDKREADRLSQQIEDGIADLAKMEEAATKSTIAIKEEAKALETLDTALKPVTVTTTKQISEGERFIVSLRREAELLGKTSAETKRLEAAKLGVSKAADPLINKIEQEEKALRDAADAANNYKNQLSKAASIAESVMTDEEKFAQTQAELNQLLNTGALDIETYNRALSKAQESLNKTRDTGKVAFNELDQFAVQAARNLQTSFADALANGLKGFDNFAKSVWSILKNLAAQIASAKILQGIGLGGTLGLGSSTASASGFDLSSLVNVGSSAMSTGFGTTGMIGRGISSMGSFFGSNSLSAFGGGMASSEAAAFLAAESAGGIGATASSMGSAMGAAAGPLMAAAAATAIGRSIAGDKRMGGPIGKAFNFLGDIPILGDFMANVPIMNALFGRGPLKQKETFIDATIGSGGIESGFMQTGFKAKGGLFRSDKRDFARVDALNGSTFTDNNKALGEFAKQLAEASKPIFELFNASANATSSVLHQLADNLGLSTDALDNFSTHIHLVSESGKALTEEQIAGEIQRISDEMIHSFIPGIDGLMKSGETLLATVQRLGTEFTSLENAAAILSGSAQEATAAVQALSFEQRTALVDQAGGSDALDQMIGFFGQNFLSQEERFGLNFAALDKEMTALGLSANMTVDEYKNLVMSVTQAGGASTDLAISLLKLGPLFMKVKNDAEALADADVDTTPAVDERQLRLNAVNSAFASLQRSVEAERSRITADYNDQLKIYNDRIQSVTESVNKLKSLSSALKNTVDRINPMSAGDARSQLAGAIAQSRAGGIPDLAIIQPALNALSNQDNKRFGSLLEFRREQGKNLALINELSGATQDRLSAEEQQLDALEAARDAITTGFNNEMQRLDDILDNAKKQVDALNGINTSVLSLAEALRAFNRDAGAAGGSNTMGAGVTDQQIKDYFKVARTPDEIAQDAARFGLSSERIAKAAGFSQAQVDQFFKDNPNLPRFETGTSFVPRTGVALVHKGERIINPQQNQDLVTVLKQVLSAVQVSTVAQNKISRMFSKWDGDGMPQERTV